MRQGAVAIVRAALVACLASSSTMAQEIVSPPDRDVTAPGMMPGNKATGPLVRVPVPPPPPDPPRWRRYFLPETSDSGTFRIGDLTIHVAGVDPPAADAACDLADGTHWPCGRTALFSFRRFLHGRAVECFMMPPGDQHDVVAPCRVGKTDIAHWLIASGWARAGGFPSDDDLATEKDARCAGRGIWRGQAQADDCRTAPAAD